VEEGGEEAAQLRAKFAAEDIADVQSADMMIAFTEEPRSCASRGGRHVELGMAIAYGIPVTIIGPRENLFCWLPQISVAESFGYLLVELTPF